MDFVFGRLSSLLIHHQSFATTCENVVCFFKKWNLRSIPLTADFERWEIKCPKVECMKCSSLLSLLSVAAHQEIFLNSADIQKEAPKIYFGSTALVPEHFSHLSKSLEASIPNKKFNINALTSGVHFKEDSSADNHVDLSLTDIAKLESMGINFTVETEFGGWQFRVGLYQNSLNPRSDFRQILKRSRNFMASKLNQTHSNCVNWSSSDTRWRNRASVSRERATTGKAQSGFVYWPKI